MEVRRVGGSHYVYFSINIYKKAFFLFGETKKIKYGHQTPKYQNYSINILSTCS